MVTVVTVLVVVSASIQMAGDGNFARSPEEELASQMVA
jgi:hypothetical protein